MGSEYRRRFTNNMACLHGCLTCILMCDVVVVLLQSATVDAGGNRRLPAIGEFLKERIIQYFQTTTPKVDVSVKYIDPSYMVRSVAANAHDALTCYELAQNAVHGAMVR